MIPMKNLKRFTTKLTWEEQQFISQIEEEIKFGGGRIEDQVEYTALLLKIRRTYRKELLRKPITECLTRLRARNTGISEPKMFTVTGWELDRF